MSKEDNSQLKILRYINLSVIVSGSIGDVTGSDGLLGSGTLSFSANCSRLLTCLLKTYNPC